MGLGQERGNGHKEAELKKQMDDTTCAKEVLNLTPPETIRRHKGIPPGMSR
jgi:hypothetical protein